MSLNLRYVMDYDLVINFMVNCIIYVWYLMYLILA
jgi:hypothetical protein